MKLLIARTHTHKTFSHHTHTNITRLPTPHDHHTIAARNYADFSFPRL